MFDVAIKLRKVEKQTSLTIAALDETVRVLKKVYSFVLFFFIRIIKIRLILGCSSNCR
jgi:hypothetical protein